MLKNYLKIAMRYILRHKVYSFINIMGLAVGMACCMIILLAIQDTLSYNRFHENADDIYRVIQEVKFANFSEKWAVTSGPVGPSLKKDFPDIINAARIVWPIQILLTYKDKHFEEKVVFADGSIFEMFTFPFINGDPATALDDPNSIVLSEKIAEKYFGNENPIGKIITTITEDPAQVTIMGKKSHTFQVTGVMKNIPRNSTVKADIFMPLESTRALLDRRPDNWKNTWLQTFIQLPRDTPYKGFVQKISTYLNDKPVISKDIKLNLQPLKEVHLYSDFEYDWFAIKNLIAIVILFSGGALIILIIACLNFMNLTTARSGNRAREVGIRKVMGAQKSDLIKQFFGESILLAFVAFFVAVIVNEKTVKVMRLESVVGSRLKHWDKSYKIIGVVKNYHLRSLREDIDPLVLFYQPDYTFYLSIRLKSKRVPETIAYLEKVWKKFALGYPFDYRFLDEALDDLYGIEKIMGAIFTYASILAIFVACLGLFGLVSFMAEQRTKEIGIRKTLGASVTMIILLFSKEFTKCVLIANIIALPATYFLVHAWINGYTYRTTISFWIFILASILTIVVTLLTVSYQAVKAARANPVESLRYE